MEHTAKKGRLKDMKYLEKLKDIRRFPPILFPIWLLIFLVRKTGKGLMWLVGFWKCHYCHSTHWITGERHVNIIQSPVIVTAKGNFIKNRKVHLCDECKKMHEKYQQQGQGGEGNA